MSTSAKSDQGAHGASAATPQPSHTDDELLAAYLAGDAMAFETLYNRHKGPLYRYFVRQLNQSDAHDAFQNTWSKLLNAAARYKAEGKFQAYLFKLAHNEIMDHHRRQIRIVDTQPPELTTESLESQTARVQLRERLGEEIAKLPLQQRATWVLQQETALSLKEIAELTQSTVEGVKSRLRYAKNALKAGMQKYV